MSGDVLVELCSYKYFLDTFTGKFIIYCMNSSYSAILF